MILRCITLCSCVVLTPGHSYLAEPAARNSIKAVTGGENCPHCLQAGGPQTVELRAGGVWPSNTVPESHGLCGDPVQGHAVESDWRNEEYLEPTSVQRTYTAGEVVEFVIAISTHHMGHYEFKLCNRTISGDTLASRAEGQACLDAHVLLRAPLDSNCQPNDDNPDCQPIDPNFPGRWYLPPPNYGTHGSPGNTSAVLPYAVGEVHKMRYVIPTGFSCDSCTLQWYWSTGNSCLYDDSYFDYFKNMQAAGWTSAASWCPWCVTTWANCQNSCCGQSRSFGEEFWNCADVSVTWDGQPAPSPPPTPAPTSTAPSPCSTAAPSPAPSTCSEVWGQCGGADWDGPTCCVSGSGCVYSNDWYSQCIPGAPAPAPAPAPDCGENPTEGTTSLGATTTLPKAGECACTASTLWHGSFAQYESSPMEFCNQNFGDAKPYISAGGGDGYSGGHSGNEPCNSGQYTFSAATGWKIEVPSSARGQSPYRAFAYAQLCNGQQYSNCWSGMQDISLSFSFKTDGVAHVSAFIKMLFWTDGGNLLGLLPPAHAKAGGLYQLISFMQDDYPNNWNNSLVIQDGRWYHVEVVLSPSVSMASIFVDGTSLGSGTLPVNMLAATNGPQVGVYSFDYGAASWPEDGVTLWLDDACVGEFAGRCPSGGSDDTMSTLPGSTTTADSTTLPQLGNATTTFETSGSSGLHSLLTSLVAFACGLLQLVW